MNNSLGDCGQELAAHNLKIGADVIRDPLQVSIVGSKVVVSLLKQELAIQGDKGRLGARWIVPIALSLVITRVVREAMWRCIIVRDDSPLQSL